MTRHVLHFGDCSLDIATRELRRAGARVDLPPTVFDCIAYLAGHRDRAVGRDELVAAVGSGTITGSNDLIGHTVLTPPAGTLSADPGPGLPTDNGGQVPSMKLPAGDPAIDHGSNPTVAFCDGRSGLIDPAGDPYRPFLRTIGAAPDIGAYEVDSRDDFSSDGFERPVPFDCCVL